MKGEMKMAGELEMKLLKGHDGENRADPGEQRKYVEGRGLIEYRNVYDRPGEALRQRLGLWHFLKVKMHSWNLARKLKNGKAARGRTNESD
jgi:hypothetical protein